MAENYRVAPIMAFYGNPNIPNGAGMHFLGLTRGDVTTSPNLNVTTGKADQVGTSPIATAVWASGHAPQATLPLIDEDQLKLVEYVLGSDYLADGANATIGAIAADAGNTGVVTTGAVSAGEDVIEGIYTLVCTTAGAPVANSTARFHLVSPEGRVVVRDIAVGAVDTTHLSLAALTVTTAVIVGDEWTFAVSDVDASWGIGSGFTRINVIGTLALIPVNELGVGTNGIGAPNGQWFPGAVCTNFGDLVNNLPEGNDAFQPHDAVFMATYLDFDDRPQSIGGLKTADANRVLLPKSHRVFFKGSPRSMRMVSLGGVDYAVPSWSLPAVALA